MKQNRDRDTWMYRGIEFGFWESLWEGLWWCVLGTRQCFEVLHCWTVYMCVDMHVHFYTYIYVDTYILTC